MATASLTVGVAETPKKILPGAQAKLEATGVKRLLPGAGKQIDPNAQAKLAAQRSAPEPGFEGLQEVKTNAEPGFEGLQEVDPGFEGLQEADQLDYDTPDNLARDDNFRPAQYIAEHPEVTKDAAKFQKLLDAYRQKRVTGLETGKVLKTAAKEAPGILAKTVKGVVQLGERALDVAVQPAANVVIGELAGLSPEEIESVQAETGKEQLRAAGEVTAGTEQAITGITQLAQQGGRKLFGKAPKDMTDDELYDQLLVDAEFHKATQEISQGKGEASKAVGLDADFLQKNGIQLDQDAIANLSLVDPVTLVATGGVFKVVGLGGKILATAATRVGAEAVLNGLKTAAAKSIQLAGRAATAAGEGVQRLPLRTPSIAAAGAQIASGDVLGAIGAAAAPVAIRQGGRALAATGRAVTEAGEALQPGFVGPRSAGLTRISELAAGPVGQVAGGAAKGAVAGTVAAAPLAAAAQDSETAGALLGGGAILGAAAGGVVGGKNAVAQVVAKRYLDPHLIPFEAVDSPGYGIDGNLDRTHEAAINALPEAERNAINNFRESIRQQGGEIYVQDPQSFLERVRESMMSEQGGNPLTPAQEAQAKLYADSHAFFDGYLTDAAGQERRAIFLNNSAKGLPHDAGHLFQAMLSPEHQARLRQAALDAYSPQQLKEFGEAYVKRLGEPDYFNKLGEEAAKNKIADELIAENFSQLFGNTKFADLKAPQGFLSELGGLAAEAAEALGIDLKAGRTTPDLAAQPSFRLQNILRNAAREVLNLPEAEPRAPFLKQGELGLPEGEVVPPKPTELPTAEAPKAITPTEVLPEGETAPAVTPEVAPSETAARATERGVDIARQLTADQPEAAATVETIAASMEAGNPVLRIEHRGITQEPGAPRETGRTPRRGTQARGYEELEALQIENRKDAPPEIVSVHEKTFVPVRFVEQGGKATLVAMSMDKVMANIRRVVEDANAQSAGDLIPYEQENGKLTPAGWSRALSDLTTYAENQSNGYRGDGQKLVRPSDELGASIPAENPNYTPQPLGEAQTNFANLIQGLAPPKTARMTKGQVPGNIKAQEIAKLQGRQPEKPAVVRPSDLEKQAFGKPFEGREIAETNPLRNQLDARGVNTRALTEVTERLAAEDIATVEPSSGPQIKAPVTDVIRGGFLPGDNLKATADQILAASPDEWRALVAAMPDKSLTGEAYRVGLGLTDRASLDLLKQGQETAQQQFRAAMDEVKGGNMDAFDRAAAEGTKAQFFREAYEAATDTGSAAGPSGWRRQFPESKPPFAETGAREAALGKGEMERLFLPAEQIQDTLDPIAQAAIRTRAGNIFTGSFHGEAYLNLADAVGRGEFSEPLPPGFKSLTDLLDTVMAGEKAPGDFIEDGFVTKGGKFLNRAEALEHAQKIGQMQQGRGELARQGVLESDEFAQERSFLPAHEAGAETGKQREAREAWEKQGTESPFFQRWFKGSQVVNPARPSDPQTVYHGTTHEFTKFEKRTANPENDFGEGFYFSSDPDEVGRNYAGEGPDLTQRLEQLSDRLEFEEGISKDEALSRAKEQLKGTHEGAVMPVYLSLKKPFRLGDGVSGTPETVLEINPRSGKGTLSKFLDNLVEEANQAYEAKPEELRQEVLEAANYESIPASELIETLRNSENLTYATDENGNLVVSELIRRAIEKSGFDGIIDETVSKKFKHMGLSPDAIHYIAFKPEQVKSATGNVGTFGKKEADIRFLPGEGERDFDVVWQPRQGGKVTFRQKVSASSAEEAQRKIVPKGGHVVTVEETLKGPAPGAVTAPSDLIPLTAENELLVRNRERKLLPGKLTPETAEVEATRQIDEAAQTHPESLPLSFVRDKEGKLKLDSKGNLIPGSTNADLHSTPVAKTALENLPALTPEESAMTPKEFSKLPPEEQARINKIKADQDLAVANAMADEIVPEATRMLKDPSIEAGGTWYEDARTLLRDVFGTGTMLFAQLLAATSPKNGVAVNFRYALEAWNNVKNGLYDGLIPKYLEGRNEWLKGESSPVVQDWMKRTGKRPTKANRNNFLTDWVEKNDLLPGRYTEAGELRLKPTGEKVLFGMHSFAVLDVLAGTWLEDVTGPKVRNFLGNLVGTSDQATIDIWATRFLMRLGNKGNTGRWRALPKVDWVLTPDNFYRMQQAFRVAAERMGLRPDSLQALVWFGEKKFWDARDWTGDVGAELSDYNFWLRGLEPSERGKPGALQVSKAAEAEYVRRKEAAKEASRLEKEGEVGEVKPEDVLPTVTPKRVTPEELQPKKRKSKTL